MQRDNVILLLVVFSTALALASSANILDLLWNEDGVEVVKRDESSDDDAQKSCACKGPSCMCCVDFNLTYVDLGGPGCVHMKYLSQDEGIAVNVSYGESLLHSEQVKGPNPEPTCMPFWSVLTNLAQVCARFIDLLPHNNGLRGCLSLEPKILETITTRFNIGCFTMGPDGMKLESATNVTATIESGNLKQNATQDESEGLNEEELIAAVNETAQQGLVFFGNLLGSTFGIQEVNNATNGAEATTARGNAETSTIS